MFTKIKEKIWIYPVLLGLVLRLYKITASSIWHDEGYTMWLIRYPFGEIISRTARDVHPPAYYFFAKVWTMVFGNSNFSIRFLSLLFSIGIIYFAYKTIELVFNKRAAFWTSILIAASPFMVRFGQEARMYGVVAFFTTVATYLLVRYLKEGDRKYLYFYAPAMIIAMYTQYYSFFVIISHWIIVSIFTQGFWTLKLKQAFKSRPGVFDPAWWVANATMFVFYLPWFPVAYRQVTRVSGSYWIRPEWITEKTIPGNILQFILYHHLDGLTGLFGSVVYWLLIAVLVFAGFYLYKKHNHKKITSLYLFGFLPMVLVFTLSKLRTPVYQDRYFPFSAVALFAIWGTLIAAFESKKIRIALATVALGALFYGNYILHNDVSHNMKSLTDTLESQKQPGDQIISGELYTFLDGTYYVGDKNMKLLSTPVDGYGESSLFYDQQGDYVVNNNKSLGNRVWVVGKTGQKDYFKAENWPGYTVNTFFEENKNNGLKLVLFEKR